MGRHPRVAAGLLAAFVGCQTMAALWWMRADTAPPAWDQSWYLETSERLRLALVEGGGVAFLRQLATAFGGTKAPLLALLPLPLYLLRGHTEAEAQLVSAALIVLFCLLLYRLVNALAGPWQALVAVVATSTMPLAIGLSRQFLVEYALTVAVTTWMLLQLRSEDLSRRRTLPALGATLGIGLLTKVSFPLYVAGPVAFALVRRIRAEGLSPARWGRDALLLLVPACLIAGPWYLPNLRTLLSAAAASGFGALAEDYSHGPPLAWSTLARYWSAAINFGVSPYYSLLAVAAALTAALRAEVPGPKPPAPDSRAVALLGLWLIVPFAVFSLGVNKDYRYLLPVLPALGSLMALALFRALPGRRLRVLGLPMLLALPLVQFGYLSFPWAATRSWNAGGWILLAPEQGYAGRPVREPWPQRAIAELIASDVRRRQPPDAPPQHARVVLVVDHRWFNQNNFSYYSACAGLPLVFGAVLTRSEPEWPERRRYLLDADYVITKTGEQGPSFTVFMNDRIRALLEAGETPFSELARFALPDGSISRVYRRRAP